MLQDWRQRSSDGAEGRSRHRPRAAYCYQDVEANVCVRGAPPGHADVDERGAASSAELRKKLRKEERETGWMERETHVELLGDGVLLVPRRGDGDPRLRPLPEPRERVVRRQPRVPVERQVPRLPP